MTSTSKTGIMYFDTRSMPSSTPLYTISAVTPMNSSANMTGATGDVMNDIK